MGELIALFLILGFYFLPALLGKEKENATSILLLNLFLGWTLVGWVIALVWATSKDDRTNSRLLKIQAEQKATLEKLIAENDQKKSSIADEIQKLNDLKSQGLITDEEFENLRDKILR